MYQGRDVLRWWPNDRSSQILSADIPNISFSGGINLKSNQIISSPLPLETEKMVDQDIHTSVTKTWSASLNAVAKSLFSAARRLQKWPNIINWHKVILILWNKLCSQDIIPILLELWPVSMRLKYHQKSLQWEPLASCLENCPNLCWMVSIVVIYEASTYSTYQLKTSRNTNKIV